MDSCQAGEWWGPFGDVQIVDLATLTGAVIVALGDDVAGEVMITVDFLVPAGMCSMCSLERLVIAAVVSGS